MSTVAKNGKFSVCVACTRASATLALALLATLPFTCEAAEIWSGDFETGNFLQWHIAGDTNTPYYWQVPLYGRPPAPVPITGSKPASYYGDGSLLELVTSPVRQGRFAAKFTVKNSVNGREPADCDGSGGAYETCEKRRTELSVQQTLPKHYNAMPYMSERWLSTSYYVPADFDTVSGPWGPIVYQIKPLIDPSLSPCFSIQIKKQPTATGGSMSWVIGHMTSDVVNPTRDDVPWQKTVLYTASFPAADGSGDGSDLRADFPNQTVSQDALADVNKGGWTDWVIRIRYDARGSAAGGAGLLDVWKRSGNSDWVHVLHITPRMISRGALTYDRGICYNSPATGASPGGFGIKTGLYMDKDTVWSLPNNLVIFNDNVKVADANSTFDDMVPFTEETVQPKPPSILIVK